MNQSHGTMDAQEDAYLLWCLVNGSTAASVVYPGEFKRAAGKAFIIFYYFRYSYLGYSNKQKDAKMAASAPQINYANYPLKDIPQPHPHDVLCGRGGGTNNHIGNSHWRMLVAANKQLYITLPKRQKMLLSRSIVNAVRSQNPPGRFLQKDSKTNKWFDVGDQRAQEKTSQALREGAPDIRKKVATQDPKEDVQSTEAPTETPGDKNSTSTTDQQSVNTEDDDAKAPSSAPSAKKDEATPTPTPSAPGAATVDVPKAPHSAPQAAQTSGSSGMMQNPYMNIGAQYPGNGGMHFPGMAQATGQHGQPMIYYPGPNMAPMQVYQTMVLNEQGMMVPAMVPAMPGHGMPMMPQHHQTNLQVSGAGSAVTQSASNTMNGGRASQQNNNADQKKDEFEPIPHYHHPNGGPNNNTTTNNNQYMTPTFDEYIAAPPDGLDPAGLSFGSSVMMTDADMKKLESTGTSFGSMMSYKPTQGGNISSRAKKDGHEIVPQAMDSLEPTGISFGDVSMMSVGTKLQEQGCSFGTMMSYNTIRADAPEGGLEAIGTSFGSLSLDTTNRDTLFHSLELAAAGPEVPPMFYREEKASGNLLDCSDTESEDSKSQTQVTAQKSAAWEKMRSSIAAQTQLHSQESNEMMPPPVGGRVGTHQGAPFINDMKGSVLTVPAPNFNRNFSQLSAWSAADEYPGEHDHDDDAAAPPPPQALAKQDSESEVLLNFLSQQQR
jgi:hypothetical protein